MAKIYQSLNGKTWRVEERSGNTLFYTNHDTLADAVRYCQQNNMGYVVQ